MQMSMTGQNEAEISHILGVDFGMSKIGLAMADTETKIAFAYDEIENNSQLFEKLREIIQKENINLIILGKLEFTGENKKAFEIREIGKKIKKVFDIEIEYQEEMFTTKMAQNNLKQREIKNIKKYDNAESARIILQDFISRNSQLKTRN